MAGYEVRFYDTDGVLQNTIEKGNLFNVSISEKGMGSTDYFKFEPQRIEFETFKTDWIEAYMLPVQYQSEKNISSFYMNIFYDSIIIMNAYIDLSTIDNDDKTEEIKIIGYSFVGLLNVFSDLRAYEHRRLPALMEEWVDDIEDIVGFRVHSFDYYVQPYHIVNAIDISPEDCNVRPGVSIGGNPMTTISYGFKEIYSDDFQESFWYLFKFTYKYSYEHTEEEYYISSKNLQIFRVISPMQYKMVDEVTCTGDYGVDMNVDEIIALNTLYLGYPYSGEDFEDSIEWSANKYLRIVGGELQYTGWIIAPSGNYYFGITYESSDRPEWTPATNISYYDAMKALCLLNNQVVVEKLVSENSNGGGIQIQPRTLNASTPIIIDDQDIISSKRYYFPKITTPFSDMDCLAGNIKTYKEQMGIYYDNFFEAKRGRRFTIDMIDKYDIDVFNTITVKSIDYQVYNIMANRQKMNIILLHGRYR